MDVYGITAGAAIFAVGVISGIVITRYVIGLSLKIASVAMNGGQLNDTPVDQEFTEFEEEN